MPTDAPAASPAKKASFTCSLPMRWADMDALNHLNNALYFRFIEEARIKLLDHIGGVGTKERMSVLAHTACDFLRPVVYPATLVVAQTINRVGRTSLDVDIEITCEGEPGVVYAKGRYVVVSASTDTGRPLAWSEDQRHKLETLQALA